MTDTRKVLKAIRCCQDDLCVKCPLQNEICDKPKVEMESLPAALVEMIEEQLESIIKQNRTGLKVLPDERTKANE